MAVPSHSSSSWSDLLPELIEYVFHSLNDAKDILSCATVCSSWRYSSSSVYSRKFVPFLFVSHPSSVQFSDGFRIISPENIIFSGNDQRWICGGTGGYLLTVNVSFPFEVNLQKPFTNNVVYLPPLASFEDIQRLLQFQAISGALTLIKNFIKKAVSSTSLLDPDWVVLIIHDTDGGKLAFCRRGDKQWTGLESDHVDDIVFCSGVFFAMDRVGGIYQCELSPTDPKAIPLCSASPFRYDPCKKYFAESDRNKLWVVLQKLDVSDDYDFSTYFEIYEFNPETKEWTMVRSLRGKALFLSPRGRCIAVSAGETGSRGFIKDSSVYFIDGSLSIFEWESKQIKKLYESRFCNCMFWVTPLDILQ
ncbi:putative F-box protein [Hirschfeldia incana]|nr:putative F-box protein [Hirschfeldia incana]